MDRKMNVLDVRLDDYTAKEAMKAVTEYMRTESVNTVEIVTVDVLMQAAQAEGLKENIEKLDLVFAGDEAVLEAAEVTDRKRLQEAHDRVFRKMMFRYFHKNHLRLFILADSIEELQNLRDYLQENYGGIDIVGDEVVPEGEGADDMITNRINGAEVDCVLASLASPKQEEFIGRCKNVLNVRLWLGIGKQTVFSPKREDWRARLREFIERRILKREIEKEKKKKEA